MQLPPPLPSGSIPYMYPSCEQASNVQKVICKQLKSTSQAFGLAKQRDSDHELDSGIAENFRGRKLSWIGEKYDFRRENIRGLLAFAAPKDATPPNFVEKTFMNRHKTAVEPSLRQ